MEDSQTRSGSRLAARGSTPANVSERNNHPTLHPTTVIHLHPSIPPPHLALLKHRLDIDRRLLNHLRRILPTPPPPCTLHHPAPCTWPSHHLYLPLTPSQVHLPSRCRTCGCRPSSDPHRPSRVQLPILDTLSFPYIPPVKNMARRGAEE